MRLLSATIFLIFLSCVVSAEDVNLETIPLRCAPHFNKARVESEVIQRIRSGIYDGYTAELGIDDPAQCQVAAFEPYKQVAPDGTLRYELKIERKDWDGLPSEVKDAAIREIVYYTWGHAKRPFSPVDVVIHNDLLNDSPLSPLALLSPDSARRYLKFAKPEMLVGGLGTNAYGPNCWYNAISAISDGRSVYAKAQKLVPGTWNRARFMGPTEFRLHMLQFFEVQEPRFGDIIRYYTEDPIYGGFRNLVFGGEVHAAVYVGTETIESCDGGMFVREIAITKNGRSDTDFLIFQEVKGMDATYLVPPATDTSIVDQRTVIKKGYFRVNSGASLLDPATVGKLSRAHSGYLVDIKNYAERWLCLAKAIDPPTGEGESCFSYPANWMALPADRHHE